jgi:hypothetical protein
MTAEELTLKLGMKAKMSLVKCSLVMPLPVRKPEVYAEVHEEVCQVIREVITKHKLPIKVITFPEEKIEWSMDGLHLSEESGTDYVRFVARELEPGLVVARKTDDEVVELDVISKLRKIANSKEMDSDNSEESSDKKRLQRLERKVQGLEYRLNEKERKDNIEFSALNEKVDKADNEARRHALIVIIPRGYPELKSDTDTEKFFEERLDVIMQLFRRFDEGLTYTIKSVRHLNRGGRGRQVAEVIFEKPEEAASIRKRFVERVQTQDDIKEAIINLNQTPGTRIRVEIMKRIAAKMNSKVDGGRKATVVPHLPKPIMILETESRRRTLGYCETVKSLKYLLDDQDLNRIYDKMRRNGFRGSAERSFAIIEDMNSDDDELPAEESQPSQKQTQSQTQAQSGRGRGGRGRGRGSAGGSRGATGKRPLEDNVEQMQSSSKIMKP